MDIKLRKVKMKTRRWKRRKGDTADLAAQLAPLEEQDVAMAAKQIGASTEAVSSKTDPNFGAIVVDNDDLKIPKGITEYNESRILGMEPVVVVILIVMISFIIFVAWQISLTPDS